MNYPICKIPTKALEHLIRYTDMGIESTSWSTKRSYVARILTYCSALCDCGILTFQERMYVFKHFRTRIYFPSCDGNCQECEHAVWRTENLGESRIIGCKMGGNAQ